MDCHPRCTAAAAYPAALAVYWLTEGLTITAARISRVALLPYLVFYSAFDPVVGLSNGLVVKYGSELPASRAGRANRRSATPLPTSYIDPCSSRSISLAPCRGRSPSSPLHLRRANPELGDCNDHMGLGPELSEQSIMLRLLDRSRCCYLSSPRSCSVERALSGLRLT